MKRTVFALTLAAALGSGAALAFDGDDTFDPTYPIDQRSGVEVRTLDDGRVVERYWNAPPAYVERNGRYYYYGEPGYDVRPYRYDRRYDDPAYRPLFPQQGQRVERGLFNRSGPNDFGH